MHCFGGLNSSADEHSDGSSVVSADGFSSECAVEEHTTDLPASPASSHHTEHFATTPVASVPPPCEEPPSPATRDATHDATHDDEEGMTCSAPPSPSPSPSPVPLIAPPVRVEVVEAAVVPLCDLDFLVHTATRDVGTHTSMMWDTEMAGLRSELQAAQDAVVGLECELERERHKSLLVEAIASCTSTPVLKAATPRKIQEDLNLQQAREETEFWHARCNELQEDLNRMRSADRGDTTADAVSVHDRAVLEDEALSSIALDADLSALASDADRDFCKTAPQEELTHLRSALHYEEQRCDEALQELHDSDATNKKLRASVALLEDELADVYLRLKCMEEEKCVKALPDRDDNTLDATTQTTSPKAKRWAPVSVSDCTLPMSPTWSLSPISHVSSSVHSTVQMQKADSVQVGQAEAELRDMEKARDSALLQRDTAERSLSLIEQERDDVRGELQASLLSANELRTSLEQMTLHRDDLHTQLHRAVRQCETLEVDLDSARNDAAASVAQRNTTQKELTTSLRRYAEKEAEAAEAHRRADDVEDKKLAAERRAIEAECALTGKDDEVIQAQLKADAARKTADDTQITLAEHTRRAHSYEAELRKLRNDLADLSDTLKRNKPIYTFGSSLIQSVRDSNSLHSEDAQTLITTILNQRDIWNQHLRDLAIIHIRIRNPQKEDDAVGREAGVLAETLRGGDVGVFLGEFAAGVLRVVEEKRRRVVVPGHGFNRTIAAAHGAVGRAARRCCTLKASFAKNMYTIRASDGQEVADIVTILDEATHALTTVLETVPKDERRSLCSPRPGGRPSLTPPKFRKDAGGSGRRPLRELSSHANVVKVPAKRVVKRASSAAPGGSGSGSGSSGGGSAVSGPPHRRPIDLRVLDTCATPPHRVAGGLALQPARLF